MSRIAEENAREGTKAWWGVQHAPPRAIEGYTTQASIRPGGQLELCVSTDPVARYRIVLYRLGWYGGAGGREVLRTRTNIGLARAAPDPDAEVGIVRAGWPVTDVVTIPADAVSGWWVAHLELVTGPHTGTIALVPFVVRPAQADHPAMLVQIGVNTIQAYNGWGGKSLYASNSTDGVPARKVSFDRPAPAWSEANLNAKAPFHYDLPLTRWLERCGFEAAYQTNVDTHREPWSLLGRRLLVSSGHDEYWTREIYDAFEQARDRGTCLAFMGANACYWQARFEDAERTLVVYKDALADPVADPRLRTVQWRRLDPPRPERRLVGVQYEGGQTHPRTLLDYAVDPGGLGDPWAQRTGLEDRRPVPQVVGYEWDSLQEDDPPPGLVRFLSYEGEQSGAACIRWTAASGARVLATGSLALPFVLDDWTRGGGRDARIQALVRNAFDDMLS